MADPTRLLDDPDSSAFARSLLSTARADEPSAKSRARAARRLGVAAAVMAGAGAGTEATAVAAAVKAVAVVVVLGGVVGLALWRDPSRIEPQREVAVVAAKSAPPRAASAEPLDAPPARLPDAPARMPEAPPAAPAPTAQAALPSSATRSPGTHEPKHRDVARPAARQIIAAPPVTPEVAPAAQIGRAHV